MLGKHCLKTWNKTQSIVAKSSADAEFYGVVRGAIEGLGIVILVKEKSAHLAAFRRPFASLAFTDYCAPMNGLVGQLATRWPQVALPRCLPMDWAFALISSVGELAARRPQVALSVRLPED